jgi:SPX domain protein involved in polyphosphate accumulation
MYIQYIGFNVAASSRIYNFDVIDKAEEAREFTVKVQSEAFRSAHLKFQDGPDICFERLEQELERETQESRAEAHLSIGERDIQEYLEGHYPRKPLAKKTASSGAQSSRITGTSGAEPYRLERV